MALHKVMIMGRDSSTTKEDYITVNNHKLAVDVGTTPDTNAGDFASIAADIATVKADLASVNCNTYKGSERTTTTGAAEELTIPAGSKKVLLTCAPDGEGYIDINSDASTSSPIYINELTPVWLPLGSVTKLSSYVVAGNIGAAFFG